MQGEGHRRNPWHRHFCTKSWPISTDIKCRLSTLMHGYRPLFLIRGRMPKMAMLSLRQGQMLGRMEGKRHQSVDCALLDRWWPNRLLLAILPRNNRVVLCHYRRMISSTSRRLGIIRKASRLMLVAASPDAFTTWAYPHGNNLCTMPPCITLNVLGVACSGAYALWWGSPYQVLMLGGLWWCYIVGTIVARIMIW